MADDGLPMDPRASTDALELLLEVWRDAARNLEIGEFVRRVAPAISRRVEFDRIYLRRIERERPRVETLATAEGARQSTRAASRARSDRTPAELERLLVWCRSQRLLRSGVAADAELLGWIVPDDTRAEWLAGPLARGSEHGAVLLAARRPFTEADEPRIGALLEAFAAALEHHQRLQELERLREAALADNQALLSRLGREDISVSVVGADAGLRSVMQRVEKVASTDAPVLVLGETGSGKEVIARSIHSRSNRASGPMVRVNCGAIPTELVDSELFGHEKGSFTGAIATHHGVFERADGGTLFLDEIGELTAAAQVRLLRILQDGSFERVGAQETRTVDVRLVAATHRNLEDMVAAGSFRRDLWYRISVFPIHLPPLRERIADIPHLAEHFAAGAGRRLGGAPLKLSASDVARLLEYPWPGNVRELAAVIERAAILGEGRHLEIAAALGAPAARATGVEVQANSNRSVPADARLDDAMRLHIESALAATHGRIEGPFGAGRRLGVNPHTLRARMRKLGIEWQRYRPSNGA